MDAGPSRRQSSTQPASADPGPSSRASRSSSLSVELDHQADLKVKSTQAYKEETAAAEKLWEERHARLPEVNRKATHRYHQTPGGQIHSLRQTVFRRSTTPRDPLGFEAAVEAEIRKKMGEEGAEILRSMMSK